LTYAKLASALKEYLYVNEEFAGIDAIFHWIPGAMLTKATTGIDAIPFTCSSSALVEPLSDLYCSRVINEHMYSFVYL